MRREYFSVDELAGAILAIRDKYTDALAVAMLKAATDRVRLFALSRRDGQAVVANSGGSNGLVCSALTEDSSQHFEERLRAGKFLAGVGPGIINFSVRGYGCGEWEKFSLLREEVLSHLDECMEELVEIFVGHWDFPITV
jgi:hypothetical protein